MSCCVQPLVLPRPAACPSIANPFTFMSNPLPYHVQPLGPTMSCLVPPTSNLLPFHVQATPTHVQICPTTSNLVAPTSNLLSYLVLPIRVRFLFLPVSNFLSNPILPWPTLCLTAANPLSFHVRLCPTGVQPVVLPSPNASPAHHVHSPTTSNTRQDVRRA